MMQKFGKNYSMVEVDSYGMGMFADVNFLFLKVNAKRLAYLLVRGLDVEYLNVT